MRADRTKNSRFCKIVAFCQPCDIRQVGAEAHRIARTDRVAMTTKGFAGRPIWAPIKRPKGVLWVKTQCRMRPNWNTLLVMHTNHQSKLIEAVNLTVTARRNGHIIAILRDRLPSLVVAILDQILRQNFYHRSMLSWSSLPSVIVSQTNGFVLGTRRAHRQGEQRFGSSDRNRPKPLPLNKPIPSGL